MMNEELKLLLTIDDRIIAEDIQNLLEESEIFTILVSDNPASSILTTYSGLNPVESIEIQINSKDYDQAIKILIDSSYKDLLVI